MIYAYFFGLAVIAGECVWLLTQRVRHRARWIAGLAITAFLALPLLAFLLSPGAQQHQLLPHPHLKMRDYVAQTLALILGDQSKGQRVLQLVAALFLLVVLFVLVRSHVDKRSAYLAAPLVVAPALLGFAMSLSVPASFASRYLIPSLLGIALLIVGALSAIRSSTGRLLMSAAIIIAFGIPLAYTIGTRPSVSEMTYRSAAMDLIRQKASADAVLTSAVPYEGAVDHYYATASGLTFVPHPTTSSSFLAGSVYTNRAACDGIPTNLPSQLWLVSEMSPDFDAAISRAARCTNLHVQWAGARGPVRIVQFSRG